MASLVPLLILLVVLSKTSAQNIRYVKPSDSNCTCPIDYPCFTLDQYVSDLESYFTTGSTFLFLGGNHSLHSHNGVNLSNVSDITFKNDSNIETAFLNGVTILCEDVSNIRIERLVFSHQFYRRESPSALVISNSTGITITDSTFYGSNDMDGVRAIHSAYSGINVINCLFVRNTGNYGGAIYSESSSINLTEGVFIENRASRSGGAIYAANSFIRMEGTFNEFNQNSAGQEGGAIHCINSTINLISNDKILENFGMIRFSFNSARRGSGLCLRNSTGILSGLNTIAFIYNVGEIGAGIHVIGNSKLFSKTKHLYFKGNSAIVRGGAINVEGGGFITLGESINNNHYFINNSAGNGGAIYFKSQRYLDRIFIIGKTQFDGNSALGHKSAGGAIHVRFSQFLLSGNVSFSNNEAYSGGGAYIGGSDVLIRGTVVFANNSAESGGGMYAVSSSMIVSTGQLEFLGNIARNKGGGLQISNLFENNQIKISGRFVDNAALCGGAIYSEVTGENIIYLNSTDVQGNSGSALCVLDATVAFIGVSKIEDNTGRTGGAIYSRSSSLFFTGKTLFSNNSGSIGGAIYSLFGTTLTFNESIVFTHNTVDADGGALYVIGTKIILWYGTSMKFEFNSARNGGVIYLRSTATLNIEPHTNFSTSSNHASEYGGAVYYEDTTIPTQCEFEMSAHLDDSISELPFCFLQLEGIVHTSNKYYSTTQIYSYNDSASKGGSFLYGGLLDRCQMQLIKSSDALRQNSFVPYKLFEVSSFVHLKRQDNVTNTVTSRPYQLCFCESDTIYDCSGPGVKNVRINRGQRFFVSLLALDQTRNVTSTVVTAKTTETATLKLKQNSQVLFQQCFNLSYNLYSTQAHEKLILYPDGPCRDTGLTRVIINATLLPCPKLFTQSGQECICDKRLRVYYAVCLIDENVYITKGADAKFWMGTSYENKSYAGLILYKTCPVDYCKNDAVNITFTDLDAQCNTNRAKLLCGACRDSYSLMFGGLKCQICPNRYLSLILVFAAAGVALVVFLTLLRLTVATGMINSLILYANIVQVNRTLILPSNARNILTVFIAWLNLDFGFEVCFYNQLDAYVQTWLQFAFPLYVWILIGVIVFTSRYSMTVSKLIGHNPIAVLATLLLLSYTKILKIIIEVYSSVSLEYPDNRTVTVWLKDANVPYLQSWHLLLTVVTSLVLIFLFLPYTLFLLLGHKLYRFSGRKYFRRMKPLLDSYYAPYRIHTRYWTGFLLLIRCALYIVFSVNSLGDTTNSLVAINITFTAIVIVAWLSKRIYKNFFTNVIEASIYLNLVALSAVTLAGANSKALVYSLIGIVFATMMGIIVYHFHIHYTAKSSPWLRIKVEVLSVVETLTNRKKAESLLEIPAVSAKSSHDPHKIATKSVIDIREPLLEN